jgi:putative heme-binding domain-containing protein
MFDPMTLRAKPEDGREIYEKECASCHRFGALGQDFGPDLTTLKGRFKKKDLLEAMLWPSKTISSQYESTIVETTDNDIINGLIVKEDGSKVVIKTAEVERPIEIPTSRIKARRKSDVSIMPEGLLDAYGQGQIANLIAFLQAGAK